MSFFISDEYTFHRRVYCTGKHIRSLNVSLEATLEACDDNPECGCVDDPYCNGGPSWYLYKGRDVTSSAPYPTCAWIKRKGKLTFAFDARMIIYNLFEFCWIMKRFLFILQPKNEAETCKTWR